jgi:hypothetical protein
VSISLTHADESLVTNTTNRRSDGHIWAGRPVQILARRQIPTFDTYRLRALILLAPADSEGASLKGSLGSLLFGVVSSAAAPRPPEDSSLKQAAPSGTLRC